MSRFQFRPAWKLTCGICVAAIVALLFLSSPARAEHNPGWGQWWLPPVHSVHGPAIDSLFLWIFWITMITFVAVEAVLVIFLFKYRSRPDRKKAFFTHGNKRLEMAWTIAPAIILAALAIGSKKVWDDYRYAPEDPNRATILVIGQQFKWNIIYPGPDGKLGRYLLFPKPTDAAWPVGADGKPTMFQNVPGPASLPYDKAVAAINAFIDSDAGWKLGKDFTDPDGADDDFQGALGRELVLPANRQIEVQLSSKDVIHDFFLPNFRVKLDAVPGMRGKLYFTSTMTSVDLGKSAAMKVKLDDLDKTLDGPGGSDLVVVIDENAPGNDQNKNKDATGWRYIVPGTPRSSIIRTGSSFNTDVDLRKAQIDRLRTAGVTEVQLIGGGKWELVCEELCGQGHNTMTTSVRFLASDEYDKLKLDKPAKPVAAASAQ